MTIQCAECGTEVDDGTTMCPDCNYTPSSKMVFVGIMTVFAGILLSLLTLIGAVVGIPMIVIGLYRIYKSSKATVESEYWM